MGEIRKIQFDCLVAWSDKKFDMHTWFYIKDPIYLTLILFIQYNVLHIIQCVCRRIETKPDTDNEVCIESEKNR